MSFVIALLQKCYGMVLNPFFEKPSLWYDMTGQAAFFGFIEKDLDGKILQNRLLLVLKSYLYKSGFYGFVCLKAFLLEIKKINYVEKKIAEANAIKHKSYLLKWNKIDNQLTAYKFFFVKKGFPHCFLQGTWYGWVIVCIYFSSLFFFC